MALPSGMASQIGTSSGVSGLRAAEVMSSARSLPARTNSMRLINDSALRRDHCSEPAGTSAAAALSRRRALERVALAAGSVFDPELDSYYEDVDLACRLRSAGLRALYVPAARARHAGAASATRERLSLVYGNRVLVAARFLGRSFWPRLPLLVLRDVLDLVSPRAAGATRAVLARAVLRGWGRARGRLHAYAQGGRPGRSCRERGGHRL